MDKMTQDERLVRLHAAAMSELAGYMMRVAAGGVGMNNIPNALVTAADTYHEIRQRGIPEVAPYHAVQSGLLEALPKNKGFSAPLNRALPRIIELCLKIAAGHLLDQARQSNDAEYKALSLIRKAAEDEAREELNKP